MAKGARGVDTSLFINVLGNFSVFGDIYWADTPSKLLNIGGKICPPGGFTVILLLL